MNDWESLYLVHKPYLMGIAFRMTGSLSEAEEIVQETFAQCTKVSPEALRNPKAWLTEVCTNKAMDLLKSAYKRRELYQGPWLPDAVPQSYQYWTSLKGGQSGEGDLLLAESLTTSFLILLEKLTPEERAVYLLSEIFDYSFAEVAAFVHKSEPACRKIAERARKAITGERRKFNPPSEASRELIAEFFEAAKRGDKTKLKELLAESSDFFADSGGKVPAFPPVLGDAEKIADTFVLLGKLALKAGAYRIGPNSVNGMPGLIVSRQTADGTWRYDTILSFEIVDNRIRRIYAQRNPDKLRWLEQPPQ